MIAGALIGLAGAMLPEAFKLFRERQDHRHELAIMQLQKDWEKQTGEQRLTEIVTQANLSEVTLPGDEKISSPRADAFGEWLSAPVRPVLTFGLFALYAYLKMQGGSTGWTADDSEIATAVMSYWFGGRAMTRALAYRRSGG